MARPTRARTLGGVEGRGGMWPTCFLFLASRAFRLDLRFSALEIVRGGIIGELFFFLRGKEVRDGKILKL